MRKCKETASWIEAVFLVQLKLDFSLIQINTNWTKFIETLQSIESNDWSIELRVEISNKKVGYNLWCGKIFLHLHPIFRGELCLICK